MRRFLAGLLPVLLLLMSVPALADEAGPADAVPAGAAPAEAEEPGVADTAAAEVDEAALNLLRKISEIQEGSFAGEMRIEADAGDFGFWLRMGMEAYAQGENVLLLYRGNFIGQPLTAGIARYENQTWFSADGIWVPLGEQEGPYDVFEALQGLPATDVVTAAEDLLRQGQISVSEETVDGVAYDVLHVTLDKSALEGLIGNLLYAVDSASLVTGALGEYDEFAATSHYWIERETQTLHRVTTEVSAKMSEPAVAITAEGDIHFRPLEGPIPFPEQITSPAPVRVVVVRPQDPLPSTQELMAKFRGSGLKASGQIYASVENETTWGGLMLDAEVYSKGIERVASAEGSLLGTPVQSGVAVRRGSRSTLGADGSWHESDAALSGVLPFDNPAAFLAVPESTFGFKRTVTYERVHGDRAVYVVEMEGDTDSINYVFGLKLAENPENEVSITLLLDKETGLPIQQDLFVWVVDEQGMIHSLYGTLEIESWEEPLPFPGEPATSN